MNKTRIRIWIVFISPLIILITGNIAARLFTVLLGKWAWIGYFLVYWTMIAIFMAFAGQRDRQKQWFRRSRGSRWWTLPAIAIGLIPFPVLLIPNINVFSSLPLAIALSGFALINATFEEMYWRGFLLDETSHLPRAYGVLHSTIFFTLIHPVNLGVFSKIQAYDPDNPLALIPFLVILIMLSLVYSLIYIKTESLRLPIFSHVLTDIGNLSIFVFRI
jgi:membrane protease YdiL (CAAX protease family)